MYVGGQVLGDFVGAVAGDEGDFAYFAVGVEDVEEGRDVGRGHAGTNFDADGVGEAAEEFNVCIC